MNKRFLSLTAILSMILIAATIVVADLLVERTTVTNVRKAFLHSSERQLALVTSGLRGAILSGDLRRARAQLEAEVQRGNLVGYEVTTAEDGIVASRLPNLELEEELILKSKIYYSDDRQQVWGEVSYYLSPNLFQMLQDSLNARLLVRIITLTIVFSSLFAVIVYFLMIAGRSLEENISSSLLRKQLIPTAGGFSRFWRPMIEHFNKVLVRVAKLEDEVEKANTLAAIARTTQALAHDIRKPMTMFSMIAQAVERTSDPGAARELLRASIPEIKMAIQSVNGMIADVLEVGANSKISPEETNPATLVESCLGEVFRIYPESNIDLSFDFAQTHTILIDTFKINRTFVNIVTNAVQAMNGKGAMWFRTRDTSRGSQPFVEFCIGNSGSYIPPESIKRLFDAFFTSNKKGGTGLGLAIVEKIVRDHGGEVWCESSKNGIGKVEFFVLLPAGPSAAEAGKFSIPSSSREIAQSVSFLHRTQSQEDSNLNWINDSNADSLISLERELSDLVLRSKKPVSIVFVDDEPIYRNGLPRLLRLDSELEDRLLVRAVASDRELYALLETESPVAIVLDVDLGSHSAGGYDIAKRLRSTGYSGTICIHSNRQSAQDTRDALAAGADAVLPKPMAREHLLKLFVQALRSSYSSEGDGRKTGVTAVTSVTFKPPVFAVVDDSPSTLLVWRMKSRDKATVFTFDDPARFWEHVHSDPTFLEALSCVVTDQHFAEGSASNGLEFASALKAAGFHKPIFLSSNSDTHTLSPDLKGCIDKVIPKEPLSFDDLRKLF